MRLEAHRTSRLEESRSGRPLTSTSTCPKVVGFFPFRVQIIECWEPVHQSFSRSEPVYLAVSRLVFKKLLASAHARPDCGFDRAGMGKNTFHPNQVGAYRIQGRPSTSAGKRKDAVGVCFHHFTVASRAGDGLRVDTKERQVLIDILDLGAPPDHIHQ